MYDILIHYFKLSIIINNLYEKIVINKSQITILLSEKIKIDNNSDTYAIRI